MPEVPRLLANVVERLFSTSAEVIATSDDGARLKRVSFRAAKLVGAELDPRSRIEFRVGERSMRH